MAESNNKKLILFDGVCTLCSGFVRFVVKRDPAFHFRFATLQSSTAREVMALHGLTSGSLESLILVDGRRCYTRSAAALRIARYLVPPWCALALFLLVPTPIRDWIYSLVARNRYHWFGKEDYCEVPSADDLKRFDL